MDLQRLKYFIEVARIEHMGKASNNLAISQSALSYAISSFEDDLGVQLFVRKGRRIFLTDPGRRLFERGAGLLKDISRLEDDIRTDRDFLQGTLRVVAPYAINATYTARAWSALSKEHPSLKAEILSARSIDLLPKIIDGSFDLGVCFGEQAHPLIESLVLIRRKLVIAAKKSRVTQGIKSLKEAKDFLSATVGALPLGLLGFGYGDTHPMFERHGLKPSISLLYDSYEVAMAYIRSSDSWALLPDWIIEGRNDFARILPERVFEPLPITAVFNKTRPRSKPAELLLEILRNQNGP